MLDYDNPWKVSVLTLFPEMFPGILGCSIAGKALDVEKWLLESVNIRDFSDDKHSTVDDRPFGGGAGMVIMPEVLGKTIDSVINSHDRTKLIYMSPRGSVLNQSKVQELITHDHIAIICGRYEGIDQRVIDEYDIEEISVGDFILSGGEIAAFTLIDACVRKLNGVLGNEKTLDEESFAEGKYSSLLEYPHYTRPVTWRGRDVPKVLLSGNHRDIESWRFEKAKEITKEKRCDLWKKYIKQTEGT